ncbi:MAG: DUF4874 domain-containing protein, partial [Lachnospiraceae bacterium]|nr:DUF4874 domain-containing protein [Lachnospiraceae bacterium]
MGVMKPLRKIYFVVISVFCVLGIMGFIGMERGKGIRFEAAERDGAKALPLALQNPYRGWYQINQYLLSDDVFPGTGEIAESLDLYPPYSLSLVEFNLKEYANSALSEKACGEIRQVFSEARKKQLSLIVRFSYDWEGKAAQTEPSDRAVVEAHIRTVAPLLNEYKDIVFVVQGLFVGDYGEMHDSRFLNKENRNALAKLLYEEIDPEIFLSVRTPTQWRELTSVLPGTRLGLYNDGLLASDTDLGTYQEGTRETELFFQNDLCRTVPNGGEVLHENPMNDTESAIEAFETMRLSYLNGEFDAAVLDKWKQSQVEGQDGFSAIGRRLGYLYELADCQCDLYRRPFDGFAPSAKIRFSVENAGFAPAYRRFDFECVVMNDGEKAASKNTDSKAKALAV